MRSIPQFRPGDRVVTIAPHEGFPVGTDGTIASRWVGTLYAVRLPNGDFHWLDSTEIGTIDPNTRRIRIGDTAMVTSDKHQHPTVRLGDLVQVVKIMEDTDYYGVIIYDELHWLAGFELAPFL